MSSSNTYKFIEYLYVSPIRSKIGGMSIFSENLKRLRKASGFTQPQMADLLGILRTNYVPYENKGGPPGDEMLEKIAEILNVSPELLKTWKEADEIAKKREEAIELAYRSVKGIPTEVLKDALHQEIKNRRGNRS